MLKKFFNFLRPFLLLAAVALIFIAAIYIVDAVTRDKEPQPAPDISGVGYDETTLYSLSDQFNETPTVLVFFDPEVEKSTEMIQNLLKAGQDRALIFAVSVSEKTMEEQKSLIDPLGLEEARVVFDLEGAMAETYGLRGVPTTYFIDKDGMIHEAHLNSISAKTIEKALNKIA